MKRIIATVVAFGLLLAAAACGSGGGGAAAKEIKSGTAGQMTVTLANADGVLRHGEQELTVTFKDASGKTVDVGSASLNFHMPAMGAMAAMNDAATLTTTPTPGVYRAKVNLEMGGEWQAQIAYEGPAGSGRGSFPVTAQ
ncbi:MAG TPA: FixH family protein [Pyrinomonadaceae bacterium]|nr:FixH family protein [Pyrinomonadaceae bacterium]